MDVSTEQLQREGTAPAGPRLPALAPKPTASPPMPTLSSAASADGCHIPARGAIAAAPRKHIGGQGGGISREYVLPSMSCLLKLREFMDMPLGEAMRRAVAHADAIKRQRGPRQ